MKKVRLNIFETNSSSTHAMYILPIERYREWNDNDYFLDTDEHEIITKDELEVKIIKNNWEISINDLVNDHVLQSDYGIFTSSGYNKYIEDLWEFEPYYETYKHPNGTEIVIFGYSGYSG